MIYDELEHMPFIVNDGDGFVCSHCKYVFPRRDHFACEVFGEWGRDLCLRCCETRYACRRLRGWICDERRHLEREGAFADSVWAPEPPGGYDCRQPQHPVERLRNTSRASGRRANQITRSIAIPA